MPNPYPISIVADDGVTEVVGKAKFTDPANQPGSAPAAGSTAHYNGNVVNIADGLDDLAPWNTLAMGAALLDLTVPASPTVKVAGIYAVSVSVQVAALTAGGTFNFALLANGVSAAYGQAPQGTATVGTFSFTMSATAYFAAGNTIEVDVTNQDGASARDFNILYSTIQRIS